MSLIPETFAIDKKLRPRVPRGAIGRYLLNGAIVCAGIFVFPLPQLAFALPAGYALAKLNFRRPENCFAFVMLGLLIPPMCRRSRSTSPSPRPASSTPMPR